MWSLGLEQYAACLGGLLVGGIGIHLPIPKEVIFAPGAPTQQQERSPQCGVHAAAQSRVASGVNHSCLLDIKALVFREVRALISSGDVDLDVPLMDAGLDSHATTELANRLGELTGLEISGTLVFEQPSARAIASHLSSRSMSLQADSLPLDEASGCTRVVVSRSVRNASILGAAGRWPGSCADRSALWLLMRAGGDTVRQAPSENRAHTPPILLRLAVGPACRKAQLQLPTTPHQKTTRSSRARTPRC